MTDISFGALGVPASLVDVLAADGKTTAFPIQVDTLPDTLAGSDVLGRGKTGSGKTLAFSIPMVARLKDAARTRRAGRPSGLVLAPTRELATQIDAVLAPLARAYGLTTTTIFGGVNQNRQVQALRGGVDIVVACPGRLEDLMKQGFVTLDAVEITVIDEADHMADLGFLPGVTRILNATPRGGQRLLFSATLDNGVDKLVSRFLQNEVLHSVDEAHSPVAAMTHHVFTLADTDAKNEVVRTLASGMGRRILFMRTKHQAKKLAKKLTAQGIPAVDLHGNLSQPQRDRNLAAFSSGRAKVLVATDVAARGVHVDDVELVVHVDPPAEHKAYLHRSGRTARAGAEGSVVTLVLPGQERDVKDLLRKAAITAPLVAATPASDAVVKLVGEVAPYVAPTAAPEPQRGGGTSQGANAQRKRAAREGRSTDAAGQGSAAGRGDGTSSRSRRGRTRAGAPRHDATAQSRTAGQGAASGRQAAAGRTGRAADDGRAPHRDAAAAHAGQQARSAQQPAAGRPRTAGRRASHAGGAPKLMVGSVVRQNGGGRRSGR